MKKVSKNKKVLTVDELIEVLSQYDGNLPCIITHIGKDHQYGITLENIYIKDGVYFGNDWDSDQQFPCEDDDGNELNYKFLNVGSL